MPKNKSIVIVVLALIALVSLVYIRSNQTQSTLSSTNATVQKATQPTPNRGNCLADDCLAVSDLEYPAATLPENVVAALNTAIQDEYKALAVYQAVTAKFGMVRPFSMIMGAEEQHIASLKSIFDKYGLVVPVNNLIGKITAPKTLAEACQIGVDAEIANAALYQNELLPTVSSYPDITSVFTNLMNASQNKHLAAFERCN